MFDLFLHTEISIDDALKSNAPRAGREALPLTEERIRELADLGLRDGAVRWIDGDERGKSAPHLSVATPGWTGALAALILAARAKHASEQMERLRDQPWPAAQAAVDIHTTLVAVGAERYLSGDWYWCRHAVENAQRFDQGTPVAHLVVGGCDRPDLIAAAQAERDRAAQAAEEARAESARLRAERDAEIEAERAAHVVATTNLIAAYGQVDQAERYRAGALPREEIEHLARQVALAPIEAAAGPLVFASELFMDSSYVVDKVTATIWRRSAALRQAVEAVGGQWSIVCVSDDDDEDESEEWGLWMKIPSPVGTVTVEVMLPSMCDAAQGAAQ
ncbi:MAG: hypothetical protein BWZ09_02520 [Alphaproteobacteria bacterium ADurb.BinA305]|nr:MAG: hypothetical protein BWZ09_02520 [Alphaproteobacteria bacterium ADurb.BinA305]